MSALLGRTNFQYPAKDVLVFSDFNTLTRLDGATGKPKPYDRGKAKKDPKGKGKRAAGKEEEEDKESEDNMEKGSDPFVLTDDPTSDEEEEDLPKVTKAFVKPNKGKEGGRQPTNT